MDTVTKEATKRDEEEDGKGKKVEEENIVRKLDPILKEEPFLKVIKELGGKALEGIPLFKGKMDLDFILDWIEGMENHFECKGVIEAQEVKVATSTLRGLALTWWKYVQGERVMQDKGPIANWKAMVMKIHEKFLIEDFVIQLHQRRQGLKQKDMDVASYTEEF